VNHDQLRLYCSFVVFTVMRSALPRWIVCFAKSAIDEAPILDYDLLEIRRSCSGGSRSMPEFDIALQHVFIVRSSAFFGAKENGRLLMHFVADYSPGCVLGVGSMAWWNAPLTLSLCSFEDRTASSGQSADLWTSTTLLRLFEACLPSTWTNLIRRFSSGSAVVRRRSAVIRFCTVECTRLLTYRA
jgi:hypothetical protein